MVFRFGVGQRPHPSLRLELETIPSVCIDAERDVAAETLFSVDLQSYFLLIIVVFTRSTESIS